MEAECSDDVMKLRVKFNDTFSGLIYSAGKIMYYLYFELIITLQNLHYLETYTLRKSKPKSFVSVVCKDFDAKLADFILVIFSPQFLNFIELLT